MLKHDFPSLVDTSSGRKPVILIGAGMSWGEVALPGDLLADRRANAESDLGWTSAMPIKSTYEADDFYAWADEALAYITRLKHPIPKLRLAEVLGLLDDPKWLGLVKTRRTHARHRVMARLAKEPRWAGIWSLNWDCYLEQALESCGIKRGGVDEGLPWVNRYKPMITLAECNSAGDSRTLTVMKPHGCAHALREALRFHDAGNDTEAKNFADRFLLTKSELEDLGKPDKTGIVFFAMFASELAKWPFYTAGWSASEGYLRQLLKDQVEGPKRESATSEDELSIIDVNFNSSGHAELAAIFGVDKDRAYVPVETSGFTTNVFFLYVQALYGLDLLERHANDTDKPHFKTARDQLKSNPAGNPSLLNWFDCFLPAWVRLCWALDLCPCLGADGNPVKTGSIRLDLRDEHIPWHVPNIHRIDMVAASWIFSRMFDRGRLIGFDYEKCQGSFFHGGVVSIPVPWSSSGKTNDLRAFRNVFERIDEQISSVTALQVLRVNMDAVGSPITSDPMPSCIAIAGAVKRGRFSSAGKCSETLWEDL